VLAAEAAALPPRALAVTGDPEELIASRLQSLAHSPPDSRCRQPAALRPRPARRGTVRAAGFRSARRHSALSVPRSQTEAACAAWLQSRRLNQAPLHRRTAHFQNRQYTPPASVRRQALRTR
jgi:hypothetical protein